MPLGPLLIVAHLDPKKRGSLEEQMAALAQALGARGIRTHGVFARPPTEAVAALFRRAGMEAHVADFRRPLDAAWTVARLCRQLRPQLVHLHFVRPLSPLVQLAPWFGARVVLTDHLALGDSDRGRRVLRRSVKRAALHFAGSVIDCRVAVSSYVAASIISAEGAPAERVRVVPNGIDLQRFAAKRAAARSALRVSGLVVACVARMAHEKGVDVALRAFARLERPATLLICGDGPDRRGCEALAASLGIGASVRFLGLRNDVERVLAASDQVWVPSRNEAFGLAAAEAMAAERPVIASGVGGLCEVVAHNSSGMIVSPDDPNAFANAARALFDDPARACAFGQAGRRRAEALFSLDRYVDRMLSLYGELVPRWRVRSTVDATTGLA